MNNAYYIYFWSHLHVCFDFFQLTGEQEQNDDMFLDFKSILERFLISDTSLIITRGSIPLNGNKW